MRTVLRPQTRGLAPSLSFLLLCAFVLLWAPARASFAGSLGAPAPQPQPAKPQPSQASPSKPHTAPPPAKPSTTGAPPAKKTSGTPSAAAPGAGARKSEVYGDRLDTLEAEVDALKDKIFRSKARLALLKETVLRGVLAGSRVILAHRNRMGASFRLIKIVYVLDGAQIYARNDDSGTLDQEDELVIFDGNLPPGPHTATIELTYRGHGYGVFAYLSGYTFDSRSTHTFTAPPNGAVKVTSVGFERGNMTTEMRDRPSVDWQSVPLDAVGRPLVRGGGKDGAAAKSGRRTSSASKPGASSK